MNRTAATRAVTSIVLCTVPCNAQPTERLATLNVDVSDPAGQPLPGLTFAITTPRTQTMAVTDANGAFSIELAGHPSVDMSVCMLLYFADIDKPGFDYQASLDAMLSATTTYSFSESYQFEIPQGQDDLDYVIEAGAGVSISGTVVDGNSDPVGAVLSILGAYGPTITDDAGGAFEYDGVPQAAPATLVVMPEGGSYLDVIDIPATSTAVDTDIGQVSVSEPPADASVQVTVQAEGSAKTLHGSLFGSMSLVREDGSFAHILGYNSSLQAHVLGNTTIPIQSGTYYIVPGSVTNVAIGARVLVAARAGQSTVLDGAGVPKITVDPGDTLQYVFDPASAEQSILSLP